MFASITFLILLLFLVSSREGYNDEVGSIESFVFHEVRDEGDSLDGFSQTHLIRQDPIEVIVVEGNQPLQTFNLTDNEGGKKHLPPLSKMSVPGTLREYHAIDCACSPDTV